MPTVTRSVPAPPPTDDEKVHNSVALMAKDDISMHKAAKFSTFSSSVGVGAGTDLVTLGIR
jgi:hypothetical protein